MTTQIDVLRTLARLAPSISLVDALTIFDNGIVTADADAGVYFSPLAVELMHARDKIGAIKEVRDTNSNILHGKRFGLLEQKNAVEAWMVRNGIPTAPRR